MLVHIYIYMMDMTQLTGSVYGNRGTDWVWLAETKRKQIALEADLTRLKSTVCFSLWPVVSRIYISLILVYILRIEMSRCHCPIVQLSNCLLNSERALQELKCAKANGKREGRRKRPARSYSRSLKQSNLFICLLSLSATALRGFPIWAVWDVSDDRPGFSGIVENTESTESTESTEYSPRCRCPFYACIIIAHV